MLEELRSRILEVMEESASALGLRVVEVVLVPSRKGALQVRVFVGRSGGVTVDECARLSRRASGRLDSLIEGSYVLEVSSPGIGRRFVLREQYEWAVGRTVKLKVSREDDAGAEVVRGRLSAVDDDVVRVECGDGERTIPFSRILEACEELVVA